MKKLMSFFKSFIPFYHTIGGFILIVYGCKLLPEIRPPGRYALAFGIMLMTLGVVGRHIKDMEAKHE